MDRINTILNNLFALCHTLGGRVENLYQRIVRNDVEQATMNQGLIESLAGAHQKIRNLEAQQTILEQRLTLLERGAGVKMEGDGDVKKEVKQEPMNEAYLHMPLVNALEIAKHPCSNSSADHSYHTKPLPDEANKDTDSHDGEN